MGFLVYISTVIVREPFLGAPNSASATSSDLVTTMQASSPQKGKLRGQSSAQTHDTTHHGWLWMVGCLLLRMLRPKIWESLRIWVRICQIVTFSDLSNLPIIPRSGASAYYVGMMVLETGFCPCDGHFHHAERTQYLSMSWLWHRNLIGGSHREPLGKAKSLERKRLQCVSCVFLTQWRPHLNVGWSRLVLASHHTFPEEKEKKIKLHGQFWRNTNSSTVNIDDLIQKSTSLS